MKRIISLLLSVILFFTMTVTVAAQPDINNKPDMIENYDGYPIIVIRGFNFSNMYDKVSNEKAFSFSTKELFDFLGGVLVDSIIYRNEDALAENLIDFLWATMGNFAGDNEGNSANPNIVAKECWGSMSENMAFLEECPYKNAEGVLHAAVDTVGAENVYFLNFDWRCAPWDLAEKLNKLVESAKRNSGKDKVKIICASMGGMVTTAYLKYYGGKSVDSCTFLSSAHNGAGVAGEALNVNIEIIPESFEYFFVSMAKDNGNSFLVFLLKALKYVGVYDFLADIVNDFAEENIEKIYDEALCDIFANNIGLWALCPDALYDSAIEKMFSGCEEECPVLLEKIARCREFVFSTEETLANAEKDGVKMTFVSNYGTGLLPIYENSIEHGDRFLETRLTSGFATVANINTELDGAYLEKAEEKYISPDKVIDASTCLYKDRTWFVKNATHVAADYGTQYSEFVFTLALSEEQPTIDTFPQYPQFMQSLTLYPMT